jgi:hypothetical protein
LFSGDDVSSSGIESKYAKRARAIRFILKLEINKENLSSSDNHFWYYLGIKIMILGMWINTVIAYFLNSFYSGRLIKLSLV